MTESGGCCWSAHPERLRTRLAANWCWAADQFIFTPVGRQEDTARARAAGDEIRSVIAGYHWFTDWGRDTMISLEGLTLTTGRQVEASYILRTFAHYIRDGLIPNMFPEGKKNGLYHTADATLWFFHALHRYIENTKDHHLLSQLLPKLRGNRRAIISAGRTSTFMWIPKMVCWSRARRVSAHLDGCESG